MMLLAVDTATTSCSVALLQDREIVADTLYTAGRTHSRHLMSLIDGILQQSGLSVGDIDAIAVTRGPGTFTGLRIGLSTVKGLALARGVRVVGVSSLAALALPLVPTPHPVVAMIDARRGEVYHARFDCDGPAPRQQGPVGVAAPEAVASSLPENALLVGSGALLYRDVFAGCPTVRMAGTAQHIIRGASVGLLGQMQLAAGSSMAAQDLVPDYIRKSDAQIQMSRGTALGTQYGKALSQAWPAPTAKTDNQHYHKNV
jgi:tRNA threonylcarbamoyladenosine biosynthesis protein TsaB